MTVLSDPITMRMPLELLHKVEEIAKLSDRTRSWVIVRALKTYLATEGADILAIAEGRAQIARGEVHDLASLLNEADADDLRQAAS